MSAVKHNKHELLVYAVLWAILFLAPVLSLYVRAPHDNVHLFQWSDVLVVWRQYALLFVVFLLHNFFLAPLLIDQQRRVRYFSLVAVLLSVFFVVQCASQPSPKEHQPSLEKRQPSFEERWPGPMDEPAPPGDFQEEPPMPPQHQMGPRPGDNRPPVQLELSDVLATIILILLLGMNLGVKLYFRQRSDRQRLVALEKQQLEQQLEYLRYQVNPHFLMNTLNNIHALVDIDAERAKDSIVVLSKMLRFVLYEGAKPTVPLGRELAFTQDYIQLMRMRLTDHVKVSVSMPERVPDSQIPPLVLITFVENAFKHGVSYRQESFINIELRIQDGQLFFTCSNSKIPQSEDQHGGMGLQNVQQRLSLIYGSSYTLRIDDQPAAYNIQLVIPLLDNKWNTKNDTSTGN